MTLSDTIEFMRLFDRMRPDYVEWRSEHARRLASEHGSDVTAEARGIIESVARALESVDIEDAADVLEAMERGEVPCPMFGNLGAFVREQVKISEEGKRAAAKYDQDRERRYVCADCMDTGIVEVFNPEFVLSYRVQFMEYGGKLPPGWYGAAYRWWLKQNRAPLTHVALCDCACRERDRLLTELNAARSGQRRVGKIAVGLPACGNYIWRREDTPRIGSRVQLAETLTNFYRRAA